jgi:uncharacterized protein (DUF58 family)
MDAALHARAEKLAALLPPLLVEAERVAQSVWHGAHGRRRAGIGESFWQFRNYDAGDPASRIDWRQSARTDRLYVRMREWEAAQTVCLWADASGSMRYASDKSLPAKAERAQLLVLALASLLARGGEKARWSDGKNFHALRGRAGLERMARQIAAADESLPPPPPALRHAHMVLASDFLMPEEALRQRMQAYAAHNLRGVLLHIIDPLEESFAIEGRVELQGAEGEPSLLLPNAASMRAAYRQRFAEHRAHLMRMAESAGWFYLRHATDGSPQQALLRLHQFLAG